MTGKPFAMIFVTAIVAGSLLFLGGCGGDGGSDGNTDGGNQTITQPPKRKVRVEFRQPETGERLRRHIYAEDGVTEVELQIEYTDGGTQTQYFRKDGTLKEEKSVYPGGRVVSRHALYGADGRTVTSETKNRMDGTTEQTLKRGADGTVETETYYRDGTLQQFKKSSPDGASELRAYHEDGSLEKTEKVFTDGSSEMKAYFASGQLAVETNTFADGTSESLKYREDGSLKEKLNKLTNGNEETRYFNDDGTKLERLEVDLPGSESEVTYFHDDGKTPMAKFYKEWGTRKRAEVFNKNGVLTHIREYNYGGELVITVVDGNGVPKLRQTWESSGYGHYRYTTYKLKKVEEFATDGKTVVRELEMDYYGKHVEKTRLYDANGNQTASRQFRDDGTLEKEELMDAGGTVTSVKHYRADGTLEKEEKLDATGAVVETIPHEGTDVFKLETEDGALKQPEFDDPSYY